MLGQQARCPLKQSVNTLKLKKGFSHDMHLQIPFISE